MKYFFPLLLAGFSIFHAEAQITGISGPDEVCPGFTYTYTASSSQSGCFGWFLKEPGETGNAVGFCPCNNGSTLSSKTFTFNDDLGEASVEVIWVREGTCSSDYETKTVLKRVHGPGIPYDADGGDLSFCPGETKTVYIPGQPGPPLTEASCGWHHKWRYIAPPGWTIANNDPGFLNRRTTSANSVQVTAPSSLTPGTPDLTFRVESEPAWPWFVFNEAEIRVGYSEDVVISGPSLVCNNTNVVFSAGDVPPGTTVTWRKSSNLKWVGSRYNPSVTVEHKSGYPEGNAWVRATLNGACGNVVLDKNDLWVGEPHSIDGTLNGPTEVSQGQVVFYTFSETNPQNSYSTYDWTLPYTFPPCQSSSPDCWEVLQGGDGYNFIKVKVGASNGYVQVRRTNNCGNGGAKIKYVTVSGGGGGCPQCPQPIMSPNPMATETTISYHDMLSGEQISESEFPYEASYSIQSITGEEVMRWTSSKTSQQFRTERVRKGIYLLRIDHGMKGSQVIRILKDD